MPEIVNPWGTSDSPLWGAQKSLFTALQKAEPPANWDKLPADKKATIEMENAALLQGKVAAAFMTGSTMPLPDQVVPVLDRAILEMTAAGGDSEKVKTVVGTFKEARATFVEHTQDPTQWVAEEEEDDAAEEPEEVEGEGKEAGS